MQGRIDRPEEYSDIISKCVDKFREKNAGRCTVILSRTDELINNNDTAKVLSAYYDILWDEEQTHKFKDLSLHLQQIKAFKHRR